MADWLAIWGTGTADDFRFKPILQDLARAGVSTLAKEVFKELPNPPAALDQGPLPTMAGRAVKEFLQVVQQELEGCGAREEELLQCAEVLARFLKSKTVRASLGAPLRSADGAVDVKVWTRAWSELGSPQLPAGFAWQTVAARYRARARAMWLESQELRSLWGSVVAPSPVADPGPGPVFDIYKYQEAILQRYGRLEGVAPDPDGKATRQGPRLTEVFVPQDVRPCHELLPQLLEIPKEHLARMRQRRELDPGPEDLDDPDDAREYLQACERQPLLGVLEICEDEALQYPVLLGDPGTGKTTLLRYLAVTWAGLALKELPDRPLPLLIDLADYSSGGGGFIEFLQQGPGVTRHLNRRRFQERLERPAGLLLLLDGLDGIVDPGERHELVAQIGQLAGEHPRVRVILTSRVIGCEPGRLKGMGFSPFLLQGLDGPQIEALARRLGALPLGRDPQSMPDMPERWHPAVANPAVGQLAQVPLILTVMAGVSRCQGQPLSYAQLCEESARVLLEPWQGREIRGRSSPPPTLDFEDRLAMLRALGYYMHTRRPGRGGNLIEEQELLGVLSAVLGARGFPEPRKLAESLVESLRGRSLILCCMGAHDYAFLHPAFLTWFCAAELVYQLNDLQSLSAAALRTEVFGNHWRDPSWHEVLALVAGRIDVTTARSVFELLLGEEDPERRCRHLFLAARCLQEVEEPDKLGTVSQELQERLRRLVDFDLDYFYESEDAEATRLVREVRTQSVDLWARTWGDQDEGVQWLKFLAQSHDDRNVQIAAVKGLARQSQDPETLPLLKAWAQDEGNLYIRAVALYELVRRFKQDPEVLAILTRSGRSDPAPQVRVMAVRALGRELRGNPAALIQLKSQLQSDPVAAVRAAVVHELARGWVRDWETPLLLKAQAQSSKEEPVVRVAAVTELARQWSHDPQVVSLLRGWACGDESSFVRVAAVEQLARRRKQEPEVRVLLKKWAESDDDSFVRRAAMRELVRGFKDHEETLPLLKGWARSDDNSYVRRVVVQELARGFKDEPETLSLLKTLARSDPSSLVRAVAIRELVRGFKTEADVLGWVQEWVESDEDSVVRGVALRELARGGQGKKRGVSTLLRSTVLFDADSVVRETALAELARGFKDDTEVSYFIKVRASSDEDAVVRRAALRELAWGFKDDPEVLPQLLASARSDGHPLVRLAALEQLARGWPEDGDTRSLLQSSLQTDSDAGVRGAALVELARGFADDPKTLSLLKARTRSDADKVVRRAAAEELKRRWLDDPEVRSLLDSL